MQRRAGTMMLWLILAAALLLGAAFFAATQAGAMGMTAKAMLSGEAYSSHKLNGLVYHGMVTPKQREAAARRAAASRLSSSLWSPLKAVNNVVGPAAVLVPRGTPDYFGAVPNWANTQQLPVAVPDTVTYPGSD